MTFLALVFVACGSDKRRDEDGPSEGIIRGGARGEAASAGVRNAGSGGQPPSGGTGGGAGDVLDWPSACAASAEAACAVYEQCAPELVERTAGADCMAFDVELCAEIETLPGVSATPADFYRCYEATRRTSCEDIFFNELVPPECELTGTLPNGESCFRDLQCASGACSWSSPSECGVCVPRVGLGVSCSTNGDCLPELRCYLGLCEARVGLGDPCSEDAPLYCPFYLVCTAGRCEVPPGVGTSCAGFLHKCNLLAGAECNFDTNVCRAVSVPSLGEECLEYCEPGTTCDIGSVPPICIATRTEGQSCDDGAGPCEPPLVCVAGICQPSDPSACD